MTAARIEAAQLPERPNTKALEPGHGGEMVKRLSQNLRVAVMRITGRSLLCGL